FPGALPGNDERDRELDGSLDWVILGWPVLDPLGRYQLARSEGNERLMERHIAYFGSEAGMEAASVVHMLERREPCSVPPALLLRGAARELLPRLMSERFIGLYSLAGGLIECGKYPGEPHAFMREPPASSEHAVGLARSFIARHAA